MTERYDIVDIGVNLAHRSFNGDRKTVIQRAFDAGVRTMVITGTSQASSQEAQRIAGEYPGQLFSTAGVHPHDSRNCTMDTIAELRRLAALEQVVAIGECGLDFNRDFFRPDLVLEPAGPGSLGASNIIAKGTVPPRIGWQST